ncbi:MAG: LPS-assembly protein LptD, partial [Treponema sp.]|nr:LPS-assembly protein LptD [Treponema sp.]
VPQETEVPEIILSEEELSALEGILSSEDMPADIEVRILTPEQKRIVLDINTSTLSELAAWCRSVGLSEAGTSAELAQRLKNYFEIMEQNPSEIEDNRKIITIESARSTEYFTIEAVDEEYARLTGEVIISLKDGETIHSIKAWSILFNRSRNIITASGGVVYEKHDGDTIETFKGDTITVDLDNWSSIFLGGISERSVQGEETVYLFSGTVISRDEEEVTVLKKAVIKNANNEESLWSLNASRVWLLPGSDFAIFNAVLKVGEIPVMYIPFFYYPADEIIFHPVIGSRTREGNYVQTTTYILGRPKSDSNPTQSSLTRILGSSNDMEKKREGMFLRSTGKKAVDLGGPSLAVMLDHYANLGTYIGTEFYLPKKNILNPLNLELGIGLSQTVAQDANNDYTPYFPDFNGKTDWNWSNFLFFKKVPFRYRFKAESGITGKAGSFNWSVPYYSDPFVDSDFNTNRSQEMDWVNMIQKGAEGFEQEESSLSNVQPYSWSFSGNINIKFPNMSPYINNISLNTITSTIAFKTIDLSLDRSSKYSDRNNIEYYSPSRAFFAPGSITLYSLSGSIGGSPLSIGGTTVSGQQGNQTVIKPDDALNGIGVPRSPFESPEEKEEEKTEHIDSLVPPILNQSFAPLQIGSVKLGLDYSIRPSVASTLSFNSDKWKQYSDIDWGDVNSIITNINGDASTTLSLNHSLNLFSNTFAYKGNGVYHNYRNVKEEDQNKEKQALYNEARSTGFSTIYDLTSTVRPLYRNSIFQSSGITYHLLGDAIKSVFNGNSTTLEPDWKIEYGAWNKEKIQTHSLDANLAATIMDKNQSITFSYTLPPKDPDIRWTATFRVWISDTSLSMSMTKPEEKDKSKKAVWKYNTLNIDERLNFGTFGNFSQRINVDTEKKELTLLSSSLSLTKWRINASFDASRMLGYEWINDPANPVNTGWQLCTGEQKLKPGYFKLSYSDSFNLINIWKNRMDFNLSINTGLNFDLQRYTQSSFNFDISFTAKVHRIIDLSLSTSSVNDSIYKYIRKWPFFNRADIEISKGTETNLFKDLFNSFRFGNEALRQNSGFKMKNFRITATHYLGDWQAVLNWTMMPYRANSREPFQMNNEVSFLLQWAPIDIIKSDISFNKTRTPKWLTTGL